MIFSFARHAGVLAVMLGLAACAADETGLVAPGASELQPAHARSDMLLAFAAGPDAAKKGKRPDKLPGKAFVNSRPIADILDNLGAPAGGNLGRRIGKLLDPRTEQEIPPAMKGLGSIQARAVLEAANVTLDANGNFQGPLTGNKVDVVGKIESFYYRPGEPMHVTVEMITTASRGGITFKRAEKYRVEIPAGAMRVEERTGPDDNMFPIFARAAFPIEKPSDPNRDYRFKLWAAGEDVRVTEYWFTDGFNQNNEPVFPENQKYGLSHPQNPIPIKLASIFMADEDACFDMMFEKNPGLDVSQGGALDNGSFPPNFGPPKYCLGRCANPPIVNTR